MSQETTVKVPKDALVTHIIEMVKDEGFDEEYVSPPGPVEKEVDFEFPATSEWDVDIDDGEIILSAITEGMYAVKVRSATYNPPGQAHPAEYETRTFEIYLSIRTEWAERGVGVHATAMSI